MGWKTEIPGDKENCPCGQARFKRWSICVPEESDGLHLHWDICPHCGYKTFAHNDYAVKLTRYYEWCETHPEISKKLRSCKNCIHIKSLNWNDKIYCTKLDVYPKRTCYMYEQNERLMVYTLSALIIGGIIIYLMWRILK